MVKKSLLASLSLLVLSGCVVKPVDSDHAFDARLIAGAVPLGLV